MPKLEIIELPRATGRPSGRRFGSLVHAVLATIPLDAEWNRHTKQGYEDLKRWVETKEQAKREGRDPAQALLAMIRESKKRYLNPA